MVVQWCKYMNVPAKKNEQYKPTHEEQIANCTTHGVMIIPAICASAYLHTLAKTRGHKVIAWIYGASLILMFTVSTVFHIISLHGQKNSKLRLFFHLSDRGMIYLFIAANYMPWLILQDMKNLWVEQVIWIVWVGAVTGTLYTYCFHEKYKMLETVFYIIIGFCPSITLIHESENVQAFTELCLGGLFYGSGIVFFKSDGYIPFAHAIWHSFVAMGALCHYYAVCTYLYV